ncbi:MAG: hypothetical protein ABWX68_08285 [Arthrobacter sp.]|uniref:hypothetical protein n=1 Tax=Arthrobacter sp. TaxID=1667 RepID=UPI00347151F1
MSASRRKPLPPPKGATQTEAALVASNALDSRFSPGAAEAAQTSTPAADVRTPASYTPPTQGGEASQTAAKKKRARGEPEGMTRKTFYLPVQAAVDLEAAVDLVRAATGGRVTKHEALAALISAAAAQAPAVAAGLRAELLHALQNNVAD